MLKSIWVTLLHLLFTGICLTLGGVSLFAQSVISGRVINHADKMPVANASIFLSNTTIGNETSQDGAFTLKGVKTGKYNIIISVIGFKTYSEPLVVDKGAINLNDVEITPDVKDLKEVKIAFKADPDRERNYLWFKEQFLGKSELASESTILNPEVLDLNYDEKTTTLTASSYDFLKIENRALGFRLKYLLTSFTYAPQDRIKHKLHFEGSVLFENMHGTPAQERRWQRKRQDVYEGSEMHFFRALLSNRLDDEGFRVLQWAIYQNPERPPEDLIQSKIKLFKDWKSSDKKYNDSLAYWQNKAHLKKTLETLMDYPLNQDEIVKLTDQKNTFALGCDMDNLHITYNKDRHFSKGRIYHLEDPLNKEVTVVSFNEPYAFFEDNGTVINVNSISLSGVWAKNRVAELLPYDFEPSNIQQFNADSSASGGPAPQTVSFSQAYLIQRNLLHKKAVADSTNKKYGPEKIYVQLDRPHYSVGDTIWLKAWLFNAPTLFLQPRSGILHLEIANDSNRVVKRYSLSVQKGVSYGNFELSPKDFKAGTYIIKAYTDWMRNFSDDQAFYKRVELSDAGESNWLVNAKLKQDKYSVQAILQFSNLDRKPLSNEPLQVKLMEGRKSLYKQTIVTDASGIVNISFKTQTEKSGTYIAVDNVNNDKKAIIPFNLDTIGDADVQFLPEGGSLLAGTTVKIGYKAIGENGRGVSVTGIVVDQNQKQMAIFKSGRNGMGNFYLAVKAGDSYTAKTTFLNGNIKTYRLPMIKTSGTCLQVINNIHKDSVEVVIFASPDIIETDSVCMLLGKTRGTFFYSANLSLDKSKPMHLKVAKNLFPTGITHFILLNNRGQTLNERMVFIPHDDNLRVEISPGEEAYFPKDSIALHLNIADNTGNPVSGNFSMAVTDDTQLSIDSLNAGNILTHLLLSSDLKGFVENPGYYFQKNTIAFEALDNLLLTQGWVCYDPVEATPSFRVEKENLVKGRVSNIFDKPVKSTHVLLFSKSPPILLDTTTNDEGEFVFDHLPPVDTPIFILKAVNKNGKSFNVKIVIDETPRPSFNAPKQIPLMPWYVNSDSTLLHLVNSNLAYKNQQEYLPDGKHRLKEVVIKAKKSVKGSQNLNGPGNADITLDEKDMEAAGKKTWLQLLKENIRGLNQNAFEIGGNRFSEKVMQDLRLFYFITDGKGDDLPYEQTKEWYYINGKPIKFIIDGVSLYQIYKPSGSAFNDVTSFLNSHTAEDIKGIEVLSSTKYAMKYIPANWTQIIHMSDVSFVEITTRSGHGPIIDNTPGMFLYKPLAISKPIQFYKPKYTVKDTSRRPDYRSTINWEPNIITDADGKATVWFYAGDKPSTYTIIMEGTDFNGNLGYKRQKIVIKKKAADLKSK